MIYATLIPAIPVLFVWTRKSQFDANIGNLSYSIYIVHMLILGMASNILHQVNVHVNDNVLAVTIVMVVVLTSIMLYIFVEKPIDEIRQRRASEDSQCTSDVAAIVLAPLSRWGARRKNELLAK